MSNQPKMIVVKVKIEEDIHRYTFQEENIVRNYEDFVRMIKPVNKEEWVIKYLDDENDLISLTNQRELDEAWKFVKTLNPSILRISLKEPSNTSTTPTQIPSQNTEEYQPVYIQIPFVNQSRGRVICDGCGKIINGERWKCSNCNDYDLCADCEKKKDVLHDISHEFTKSLVSPFKICRRRCGRGFRNNNTHENQDQIQQQQQEQKEGKANTTDKVTTPENGSGNGNEDKLRMLEALGFTHREINETLLIQLNGDFVAVVQQLTVFNANNSNNQQS